MASSTAAKELIPFLFADINWLTVIGTGMNGFFRGLILVAGETQRIG